MRLNKDIKRAIVNNTTEGAMRATNESLAKEGNALAAMIYDEIYPPETQHQMNKLPDEFFSQTSGVFVELPGSGIKWLGLVSSRKVSALDDRSYKSPCLKISSGASAFTNRIESYFAALAAADRSVGELLGRMRPFIDGFHTTESLQKGWPEGLEYYKEFLGTPATNPLMVSAASINSLISELSQPDCVKIPTTTGKAAGAKKKKGL